MYTYNTPELQAQYDDLRTQQAAVQTMVDNETDPAQKAILKGQLRTKKITIANFAKAHRVNRVG